MKIAIVGSGRAARELHLPYFKEMEECEVVALCDPQVEWTRKVAHQFNVPNVYPTLREALENEKINAVCICSIPQNHLDEVLTAFEFGCHVLLEKPIAMNMDEVKKMKIAQEKAGKVFSVVHNYKFMPGIQQALKMIGEGTIGDVLHIQSMWMTVVDNDRMASQPDHWSHKLKGGRWAEALPHPIYNMYQMVGAMSLKSVHAKMVGDGHEWFCADEVAIVLDYPRGYANIQLSANTKVKHGDIIVTGSKGSLICNYGTARILHASVFPGMVLHDNLQLSKALIRLPLRKFQHTPAMSDVSGHKRVIRGFVNEVLRGALPLTPWEEAYHTMELVDKIGEEIEKQVEVVR
uniref:Inositol 2-dehydrogenase/D-chiro-inositol 3-dehydrogenase n=1 Tax=Candidatus Methanophaga sp. ANME-1 ERB7 TaxID=2759913 RepID=A0A7G9Z2I9_9EURY|nr:inositol 2-dehydrogenase/D-chiro-inositol 3-dehydrogenase [Methanosarcinales archaeon ANME-1 ERB7]